MSESHCSCPRVPRTTSQTWLSCRAGDLTPAWGGQAEQPGTSGNPIKAVCRSQWPCLRGGDEGSGDDGSGASTATLPHLELLPPATEARGCSTSAAGIEQKANRRPRKIIIMVLFVMIPLSN